MTPPSSSSATVRAAARATRKRIVPPTLDYLFHQIETAIRNATGPSLIVLDECWLFLDNEVFQNKLKEYFKDMRKKNTSIWIATQQLSDIASKPNLLDTVQVNRILYLLMQVMILRFHILWV